MFPKYCKNVIVGVVYKKKFNWFITNKDLWYLDYIKEYEEWKKCYKKMGRSEKQLNYDVGSLDDFCNRRWGITIVDGESINVFLDKIEGYKISSSKLKVMFENYKGKIEFYPSLYVNFDKKIFYSYFPEPENFEYFIPDNWIGEYKDFYGIIPKEMIYWNR